MTTAIQNNTHPESSQKHLNGIDAAAVRAAITEITANAETGLTSWAVTSRWRGGTRTDHFVDGCTIGGQRNDRKFTIQIDEPPELNGTDEFANPQEYLMSALNACMMVGYATYATLLGIRLTKLEIETKGDIDLRGFFEIDESVKNGYDALQQTVRLAGDATPEELRELHEVALRTSVNYFNITQEVPVESNLVIE